MAEPIPGRRRSRIIPTEPVRLERRLSPEVLDMERGVQAVVNRVLALWQQQDLITLSLYGESNAGKSTFADQLIRRIRELPGRAGTYGGELKGYDEVPHFFGKRGQEVYCIQIPDSNIGERDDEVRFQIDQARQAGLPAPDFSVVILNPMIYPEQQPENYLQKVDVVINNPHSHRKPGAQR